MTTAKLKKLLEEAEGATCFGVPMSRRQARLYAFIAVFDAPLSSFSTDDCVRRFMPQLKKALARAMAQPYVSDDAGVRTALVRDIQALLHRTPDARVTS